MMSEEPHEIVVVHFPSCATETFGPFKTERDAIKWAAGNIALLDRQDVASWRIAPLQYVAGSAA